MSENIELNIDTSNTSESSVWIYRHANRLDEEDPYWIFDTIYPYDPPLSKAGFATSTKMGNFIWTYEKDKLLQYDTLNGLKIFSSPFLRCLQTSYQIIKTIETKWAKEKKVEPCNMLSICIEYGLAEDIPDREVYNPLEIIDKRNLVVNYLDPNTDLEIIERIDNKYNSLFKVEDRLTYATQKEFLQRINTIYTHLMKLKNHTILICSHLDETHVAYRNITNMNVPERRRYGVMANLVNKNKVVEESDEEIINKKQNKWSIKHHLWEHHEHELESEV
jgi:broad specificity phosphatase PhoE